MDRAATSARPARIEPRPARSNEDASLHQSPQSGASGRKQGMPRPNLDLADSSQYLKGVGPVKFRLLAGLVVESVGDLLYHFPRDYYDRRNFLSIDALVVGKPATFVTTRLLE